MTINTFADWKDWTARGLIALMLTGSITWCGWVTARLAQTPTYDRTVHLIQETAPYNKERALLLDSARRTSDLATVIDNKLTQETDKRREAEEKLLGVIQNNSKAITNLQMEIAKLATIIERIK